MRTTKLILRILVAGLFTGCTGGDSPATTTDAGGGDPGGGTDDGPVPFTEGVSTLAGTGAPGDVDGPRRIAQFSNPVNVLYHDGILYVADFDNGKLRAIDVNTHVATTVIAQSSFKRPFGLALAADGTLFVSTDNDQAGNHTPLSGTIWKVDVHAKTATVVANAIGRPRGLAVLPDGRLAVADYLHHVVEIVDPTTGKATTLAGAWDVPGMVDGAAATAKFSAPYNLGVRADGNLIVTDFDNNRIRMVGLDGTTTTLGGTTAAGFADGPMTAAQFSHPQGLSLAANGDIYITDLGNFRVRRVVGDRVETIAGDGTGGVIDNDDRLRSEVYGLEGLSVVPDGSMVYVADGNRGDAVPYNRVRQIKLD